MPVLHITGSGQYTLEIGNPFPFRSSIAHLGIQVNNPALWTGSLHIVEKVSGQTVEHLVRPTRTIDATLESGPLIDGGTRPTGSLVASSSQAYSIVNTHRDLFVSASSVVSQPGTTASVYFNVALT